MTTTDVFDHGDGGYQPDPDRETTLLLDAFFDHLAGTVRARALAGDLVPRMRARHAELVAANAHRVVDEPARHNLRLTLALVAAYELLRPVMGRADAVEEVREALVEPMGDELRAGTRAVLDAAPDPFAAMVAISRSREEHAFGAGFTFEREVGEDRYLLSVGRCFYHDVLAANSAAELTPVMCAFDANWIEEIDPRRHGFRFERATTIGLGGTHCPFHFRRTGAAPEAG
ncbi:L-2-amino-thiazoline-4-carboxylic acid hydrolase [Marinitenerispora sediminis]|uniref:L-2-amino-thiazoline-4-carboxylic acid hydrolase n=1 Tax=Marinitenerispora sediminis TaxID=1931232 RepID=A0A368TBY1_9ACTN|nr:L-2-amino-thiazoline-4-carboxylic acid hydrolase [Marinitenerispora sediminis]RCV54029.1 hypothetical protein DEF28_09135 [Marinitenerispora sediminis]RCV60820.1 hypothetical protein DEF23_03765 [Marinitenerispora sediminis]RCV62451.1 hypothetical protein DEF24_01175 [Marinitenerispora sediminis]